MGETPLHILLVEDEPAHVGLFRRAFGNAHQDVNLTVVETVQAAKDSIAESFPDLMFADLLLPDGKGTELLPEQKDDAQFPIVIITSFGNEQMAADAMRTGALDYVVKSEAAFAAAPRIADRAIREWKLIIGRRQAEEALQKARDELEKRVEQRTAELAKVIQELKEANEHLEQEVSERKRIEESLHKDQKALRRVLETDVSKSSKEEEEAEETEEATELPETAVDIPAEEAPDEEVTEPSDKAADIPLQEPPSE